MYGNLFADNHNTLFNELLNVSANAVLNKINKLLKRAKILRAHTCIVHYLRENSSKKDKTIRELPEIFKSIQHE